MPIGGDLEGVTVLSVEQAVAAPYASARLADAGARVIKIERPGGDFARGYDRLVEGQSAYFVWLNRGKQSAVLDLRTPADRDLLMRMAAKADVFIQNLKPGALDGLGIGSAALRARHQGLITCDISGFGTSGPRAGLKAYDLIVQGESGLCAITGDAGGPARVGVSVCDIGAGMNAHAAILQALYARQRTGLGRAIQVTLFDSIAEWMNVPILQHLYGGVTVARAGVAHPTIAPYGAYRCAGGEALILSVQNDREWARFCIEVLHEPDLVDDPRYRDNSLRLANRAAVDAMAAAAFAELSLGQATERLERADLAYGRLNELHEAAHHPHLRFMQVMTPHGEIRVIAPAPTVEGHAPSPGPVPELGQDTAGLRKEFAGA